ncbi:MAG: hypothetical protein HY000_26135 [Planctomycetes bacterium]|nr:hypothetical protein [Planctomycetota bacterium]
MPPIKPVEDVDEQHRRSAEVPLTAAPANAPGMVQAVEDDDAGLAWMAGIGREWEAELSDEREDLYSLADGE